jgi:leucyl/phenylalanyl-tRNA---protein transferase
VDGRNGDESSQRKNEVLTSREINGSFQMFAPPVLTNELWFPDAELACRHGSADGLVAIGGDLAPERLLLAYRSGIFPWSVDPVTWWSPDPRAIFQLDTLHVSRSLARTLRNEKFEISVDRAFVDVMKACAGRRREGASTWITPQFVSAYHELHKHGAAHSVEAWLDGKLVGGVYGVAIGGFFAGESMFYRVSDASKVALYHLLRHLHERHFVLFDIQVANEHTRKIGAIHIPRHEYLQRLKAAIELPCKFNS